MNFAQAPAAFSILILIVVISGIGLMAAPRLIEMNLLRPYRVVRQRAYGPIITHAFVHADWGHLLFNSLALFSFGVMLERTIGTTRFLVLYLLGLVIAGLGTVFKHRNDPDYASLGASGAILAVVFANIVYYPTSMVFLFFVPMPAVVFAFGYLAYTWWASSHSRGRINHDAHLDGALTGLIFVGLTDFDAWRRSFRIVAAAIS
jgi:membrane associated rhomboid family serine protease